MVSLLSLEGRVSRVSRRLVPLLLREVSVSGGITRCGIGEKLPILGRRHRHRVLSSIRGGYNRRNSAITAIFTTAVSTSHTLRRGVVNNNERLHKLVRTSRYGTTLTPKAIITYTNRGNDCTSGATRSLFGGPRVGRCELFRSIFRTIGGNRTPFNIVPIRGSATNSIRRTCSLVLGCEFCIINSCSLRIGRYLYTGPNIRCRSVGSICDRPRTLSRYSSFLGGFSFANVGCAGATTTTGFITRGPQGSVNILYSRRTTGECNLGILGTSIRGIDGGGAEFVIVSGGLVVRRGTSGVSLVFSLPRAANSLCHILNEFSVTKLGLAGVRSHPVKGNSFDCCFCVSVVNGIGSRGALSLVYTLSSRLPSFAFLKGCRRC